MLDSIQTREAVLARASHELQWTCHSHRKVARLPTIACWQEIKLQARTQSLAMGAMPASMTALLQNDLVDCCQPGGRLTP